MVYVRKSAAAIATALFVLLTSVAPVLARGGAGGCDEGSGNCVQLSGDHPAAQFVGWFMFLAVLSMVLAVIGAWAMHLKRSPGENTPMTMRSVLTMFGTSDWPLEKKLALGGFVTSVGCFLLGYALLRIFGTAA